MTSGKSLSDQNSDNTQTFEDRDYFTLGPNVYTRGEYIWLLKQLGHTEDRIKKATEWPSKISPFWIGLIRDKGYTQFVVQVHRDGTVLDCRSKTGLSLFYNNSSPYSFHYSSRNIVVYTLAKDEEHAKKNAEKKRLEQFLSKSWLEHLEQEAENERYNKEMARTSVNQSIWPGINSWYGKAFNGVTP